MSKEHWYIFGFGIALGLVILSSTAFHVNLDIMDPLFNTLTLAIHSIANMSAQYGNIGMDNSIVSSWDTMIAFISFVVKISPIISFIVLAYLTGKKGLALFLLGLQFFPFVWFSTQTNAYLGLIPVALLALGAEICLELEGDAPRDYIARWLE